MGCIPFKIEVDTNQSIPAIIAIIGRKITAYMGENTGINIFKISIPDIPSFAGHQFFGNTRPYYQGSGYFIFLHYFFYCNRCINDYGLTRIMSLPMTRRTLYYGRTICYPWLLGSLWNAINITSQSNNRTTRSPFCHPGCWNT